MLCCLTLLVVLLGVINGASGGFQQCSPGWAYQEGKCLRLFECPEECCSHDNAHEYCESMGDNTRLAVLDGLAMNSALCQMGVSMSNGDTSRAYDMRIFFGGTYNHTDRSWYDRSGPGGRKLWLEMWERATDRLADAYSRACPTLKISRYNFGKWLAVDCTKKFCDAAYACERDPIASASHDKEVITLPVADCKPGWTRIHDKCYRVFNDCPGGCCNNWDIAMPKCYQKGQGAVLALVTSDYINERITDMAKAIHDQDSALTYIHIAGSGIYMPDVSKQWMDDWGARLWFLKWKSPRSIRMNDPMMCALIQPNYEETSWNRSMWTMAGCFKKMCNAGYACQMRPSQSIYCPNDQDPSPISDDLAEWTGDVTTGRYNDTHTVTHISMIPERDDGLTVQCNNSQSGELGNKYVLSVSHLKCPEGWFRDEGRCYGVVRCQHGYMCTSDMAERQCKLAVGGKPAHILDRKVNDHIANHAEELGLDYVFLGKKKSDPYPYYNWPTDGYTPTHDCIGMFAAYNNQYRGQWNDTPCDYRIQGWRLDVSTGFACERPRGPGNCPMHGMEPWMLYRDTCYGIIPCQHGFDCKASDAVDHCSTFDATPARIPNAYINDQLTHQAERMKIGYLFLGMTINQPYPYTHWATGENEPDGDSNTDCIGMYVKNKPMYKGHWNDMKCGYTTGASGNEELETGYACEIPLVSYGELPCVNSWNWIKDGHYCYSQKLCKYWNKGCSASQAEEHCGKMDAEPAAIPTKAVNDFLRKQATNLLLPSDVIFLGASKYQDELYPEMILKPITYTKWAVDHRNQPNGDESVKCVAMHVRYREKYKSQWNDIRCDYVYQKVLGFACQIYNEHANASCSHGWVQKGPNCYGVVPCVGIGSCIPGQAMEYCHSMYAYPAHLPDDVVNWGVAELADRYGLDVLFLGISKFDDGLWYPAPKGYPVTYSNWATGQPNGGMTLRCAAMYVNIFSPNAANTRQWGDIACTHVVQKVDSGTSFACKRKRQNTDRPSIYGASEVYGPLVPGVEVTLPIELTSTDGSCPGRYEKTQSRCFGTFVCESRCSSEDAVELCKAKGGWLATIDDEGHNTNILVRSLRETWAMHGLFDAVYTSTGNAMNLTSLRDGRLLSFSKLAVAGPLPAGRYCPYNVMYFKSFWELRDYWGYGSCDDKHPRASYTCETQLVSD